MASAPVRVTHSAAHALHRRFVDGSHQLGQSGLSNGVEPVAIDDGIPLEADHLMIELHLGHRDQRARVEHLRTGEDQNGSPLSAGLRQPDLAATHSWPHASAPSQKESGFSGACS